MVKEQRKGNGRRGILAESDKGDDGYRVERTARNANSARSEVNTIDNCILL